MLEGIKTDYFTDVKTPILAGMGKLLNGRYVQKMTKVGYELTRLYYDSELKDWQVGSERIKRVINK